MDQIEESPLLSRYIPHTNNTQQQLGYYFDASAAAPCWRVLSCLKKREKELFPSSLNGYQILPHFHCARPALLDHSSGLLIFVFSIKKGKKTNRMKPIVRSACLNNWQIRKNPKKEEKTRSWNVWRRRTRNELIWRQYAVRRHRQTSKVPVWG